MSVRRRPAAKGVRPALHPVIVRRRCVVCGRRFSINRRRQPWARRATCSESCRVSWAHRRRFAGCRHCDVVEAWRELVATEIVTHGEESNGPDVMTGRDEFYRPTTYREFLTGYRYERWDEDPAA